MGDTKFPSNKNQNANLTLAFDPTQRYLTIVTIPAPLSRHSRQAAGKSINYETG